MGQYATWRKNRRINAKIAPWLSLMHDLVMAKAAGLYYSTDDRDYMTLGIYSRDIMLDPSKPPDPLKPELSDEKTSEDTDTQPPKDHRPYKVLRRFAQRAKPQPPTSLNNISLDVKNPTSATITFKVDLLPCAGDSPESKRRKIGLWVLHAKWASSGGVISRETSDKLLDLLTHPCNFVEETRDLQLEDEEDLAQTGSVRNDNGDDNPISRGAGEDPRREDPCTRYMRGFQGYSSKYRQSQGEGSYQEGQKRCLPNNEDSQRTANSR